MVSQPLNRGGHRTRSPPGHNIRLKVKPGHPSIQEQSASRMCLFPTPVRGRRRRRQPAPDRGLPLFTRARPFGYFIGIKSIHSPASISRAGREPRPVRAIWLGVDRVAFGRYQAVSGLTCWPRRLRGASTTTGSRAGPPPSGRSAPARALTSTLDNP